MIIRAGWVVPVTAPPIPSGAVRIEGGRIVAVGPAHDIGAADVAVDLPDAILIPGLVNPHTHLELTCYAGRLNRPGTAGLWAWLEKLVAVRRESGAIDRERQAVSDGAAQSLRAGVTCVGDISRLNIHWKPLKQSAIRKVCFVELLSIAREPPRDPQELRDAVDSIEEDALLTAGISAHAPYTVPEPHIRASIALADELHRPWCIHWAETREEVSFLHGGRGVLPAGIEAAARAAGVDPDDGSAFALLERCARGRNGGGLAHANYIEAEEMAGLADAGHVVMYCPRAHAFFDHRRHPVSELRSHGVRVALATDSLASNESLSILDEMRFLSRARPDLVAADILAMGTIEGARVLGLESKIGSIESGKLADLVAFRVAGESIESPIDRLVHYGGEPVGVWIAGRRLY